MRVVTTCHKEGFEVYGHRWIEGRKHWPKGTEFWFYTEGYELPLTPEEQQAVETVGIYETPWIERRDVNDIQSLVEWKAKHKNYTPPDWQWDVVKYSNKVFAAIDALYDCKGIGVWLDADCVTYADIPEGYVEGLLGDAYMGSFQRTGLYTETGMWVVNCDHKEHRNFLDTWRGMYLGERYKQLTQWHDCMTLDAAIRIAGVPVVNLSGEFAKDAHPMARVELSKYIDHCKGPRKIKGMSPENKNRKVAK